MENPNSPDPNETPLPPDAAPQQTGLKRRRRISAPATKVVLSSDLYKSEEEEHTDLETELTEEEPVLFDDSDQYEGVDELISNAQYLDDSDSEEDLDIAAIGLELDALDDDQDFSGEASESDENDFFDPFDEPGNALYDEDPEL